MKWATVENNIVTNFVMAGEDTEGLVEVNDWVDRGQHVDTPYPTEELRVAELTQQIYNLEATITSRMLQEALLGSSTTGLGPDGSMTAASYIAYVRNTITTLREEIANGGEA